MGRWGHRMFEGDTDLDLIGDVQVKAQELLKSKDLVVDDATFEELLQSDAKESSVAVQQARKHLDSISDALFDHFRAKPDEFYGEYSAVVLAAGLMIAGVKISPENRAYLRQVAEQTPSSTTYQLSIFDLGFRDSGKVQFLAAVDNYEDGKPRSFSEPSCFSCGKINADLPPPTDLASSPPSLKQCKSCKAAWYCDRACQRANWKKHKLICGVQRGNDPFMLLNT